MTKKNFPKAYWHIILLFILFFLLTLGAIHSRPNYQTLSNNVIRLHIRADGNDTQSQTLKFLVRDTLLEDMQSLFASCTTREQALQTAKEHIDFMKENAQQILTSNGCTLPVSIQIADSYFPYRKYDGVTYPAGIYTAVIVEIGSGKGHNWWCVMYPPLCFTDLCTDTNTPLSIHRLHTEKITIRFRYLRFLNRFLN